MNPCSKYLDYVVQLRHCALLYFAGGSEFIKENAVFANTLVDQYWNGGVDHGWRSAKVGLCLRLTCFQVTFKHFSNQSCLTIPFVLWCSHRQCGHKAESC